VGYCHYWRRPAEIEPEAYSRVIHDFRRCVLALDDAGVPLAGPNGDGLPKIGGDEIAFNGVSQCGHPPNEAVCIPFPSEDASGVGESTGAIAGEWSIGVQLRRRTCNGNCSYEPFFFERVIEQSRGKAGKRVSDYCKTGFRPYDLAVQCALLVSKHHLPEKFEVFSSGSDWHWNDARGLCYLQLGYPLLEFRLDRDRGLVLPED
jgi:hypothetical protein